MATGIDLLSFIMLLLLVSTPRGRTVQPGDVFASLLTFQWKQLNVTGRPDVGPAVLKYVRFTRW